MTPEDRASIYLRQLVDCNCNDCIHLERDFEKAKAHKESFKGTGLSDRCVYGNCKLDGKPLFFSPNTCQVETQECFVHRNKHKEEQLLEPLNNKV